MHPTGPFSIPAIRNFVPEKLKPWVIILFVIVFQFSGGVYLAAVSEMVGSTALMQEDIMMAGYASMVGMALTFAIMFRLKFRFTSKVALLTCCTALIICNLISMYTRNVPVLIFACFIAATTLSRSFAQCAQLPTSTLILAPLTAAGIMRTSF